MIKNCSICGNLYHNITFRGGYICEDCVNYIKKVSLENLPEPPLVREDGAIYDNVENHHLK